MATFFVCHVAEIGRPFTGHKLVANCCITNHVQHFSKLIHSRVHVFLEAAQSWDQLGFRPARGVEHALTVVDTIVAKAIEWDFEI